MHTYVHTCIHAYIHTYIHTYIGSEDLRDAHEEDPRRVGQKTERRNKSHRREKARHDRPPDGGSPITHTYIHTYR